MRKDVDTLFIEFTEEEGKKLFTIDVSYFNEMGIYVGWKDWIFRKVLVVYASFHRLGIVIILPNMIIAKMVVPTDK